MIGGILIFADETADWKVAGLRQLDRILLAIEAEARQTQMTMPVYVHSSGRGEVDFALSPQVELQSVLLNTTLAEFSAHSRPIAVISTRLVPARNFFPALAEKKAANLPALVVPADLVVSGSIAEVERELRTIEDKIQNGGTEPWPGCLLRERSDIAAAEKRLLRGVSKSQDGFIARALNRPFSRALSRWLLHFPLSPSHWTVLFGVIGLVALAFLVRGDYFGFVAGAILFQLYSALDGCDGEIARVTYRESQSGRKLDQMFDRAAGLFFIICLGIGLSRQPGISDAMREFFLAEAIISAILIGCYESVLTRTPLDEDLAARTVNPDRYSHYAASRRQSFNEGDQLKLWMIKHSGLIRMGTGITSLVADLTKRDVFNFFFMLVIICGRPNWVLHIIAVCACVITFLALKSLLLPSLGAKQARLR
jgi:CDP-alcohol phosphatidyltransferase